MSIRIIPLGAGQDVGKSCILVTLGDYNIMLDCGMHMGFSDHRKFPDFSYITREQKSEACPDPFTKHLDCLIVSHFHLDHCGALPFFTEICGYRGPIYMTHPTKAITPILLEDYRKIQTEKKGDSDFFTSGMVQQSMARVTGVSLLETVKVAPFLEIKPYYAGHVLGAAMFLIRETKHGHSVLYTGDYNTTPDRHLGAAWVDRCLPDVIITESTYATMTRISKRARETTLLQNILRCVQNQGKVLIPVFALGRAQELCILLETYWERMQLQIPIYFTAGLTEKANNLYRNYINWTNESIKEHFSRSKNLFAFSKIKPWQPGLVNASGAAILFATPGMLHQGVSLEVFRRWCHDPKNMIILPGYCVSGTVGYKVLQAHAVNPQGPKKIRISPFEELDVRLQIENLSFSAHVDRKGILETINKTGARSVVLVHGEKLKMAKLAEEIKDTLKLDCFYPANGECIFVEARKDIPVQVDPSFISKQLSFSSTFFQDSLKSNNTLMRLQGKVVENASGTLTLESADNVKPGDPHLLSYSVIFSYDASCACSSSDIPWRQTDSAIVNKTEAILGYLSKEGSGWALCRKSEDGELLPMVEISNLVGQKVNLTWIKETEVKISWGYGSEVLAYAVLENIDVALVKV